MEETIYTPGFGSAIKYSSGIGSISTPIDAVIAAAKAESDAQADTLKGMQDKFTSFRSANDALLNIRIDNPYQRETINKLKDIYNINDAFMKTVTADDLQNGTKMAQIEQNVKGLTSHFLFKKIVMDQAKADKYLAETDEIYAMNPALGILAKNDYYDKYLNQKEEDYLGFPLSSKKYTPMDPMASIDAILKQIPEEFELQVDENSPTGYYFINKVSKQKIEDPQVKAMIQGKIAQLRQNPAFDNNLKALIGATSKDGKVTDESVIGNYIDTYMKNFARDKIVNVEVKEDKYTIEKLKQQGKGAKTAPGLRGAASTEKERTYERYYNDLDSRFPGYDFDSYSQDLFDAANGNGRNELVDPNTGDLLIKFYSGETDSSLSKTIRIKKKTQEQLNAEKSSSNASSGAVSSNYAPNIKGFVPADEEVTVGDIDFGIIAQNESSGDPSIGWHSDGKAIGEYGLTGDNIKKFLSEVYKTSALNTKNQIRDAWEEAQKDPGFRQKQEQWIFKNIHKPFFDHAKQNLPSLDPGVITYLADMAHQHGPNKAKEIFNKAMEGLKNDKDLNVKSPLAILKYLDNTRLKEFPEYESRYNTVYDRAIENASPKAMAIHQIRFNFKSGAPTDTVDPMDVSNELLSGLLLIQNEAAKEGFTNNDFRNIVVSSLHRSKDNVHSKANPNSDHPEGYAIDFSLKTNAGRKLAGMIDNNPLIKKYFTIIRHGNNSNFHLHLELKNNFKNAGGNLLESNPQRGEQAPMSIEEKFRQDSLANSKNSVKNIGFN